MGLRLAKMFLMMLVAVALAVVAVVMATSAAADANAHAAIACLSNGVGPGIEPDSCRPGADDGAVWLIAGLAAVTAAFVAAGASRARRIRG